MAPSDSPLHDRLLFLVGARRSGTNWLQRILVAHPEVVVVPPETHVFNMGIKPLAERFQHANPGSLMMGTMFVERDGFVDGVRSLLDRAFLDNLDRLGPDSRYVLERTPWHVYDLELIAEIYPDARVIHIVRDGRAVSRSLLAMEWGPATMEEAAEEWRSSVASGRHGAAAFGERYKEVLYEQLLADPGAGIDDLFAWLGLDLDAATRERILLEAAGEFNVDPGSPGVRADKWRGALSERDLATFQRIAGDQMAALGYPSDAGGATRPSPRELLGARVRSARATARRLRHPRAAARRTIERAVARRSLRTLESNYEVVERFETALDRGRAEEALSLLATGARVRISDDAGTHESRGEEAGRALLAFLAEHQSLRPRQLWGQVHSSPSMFTTVSVYDLPGDGRWTRLTVVNVTTEGKISGVSMYRFRTAADPGRDDANQVPVEANSG